MPSRVNGFVAAMASLPSMSVDDSAISRAARARDASHFSLQPAAILTPRDVAQVSAALTAAATFGTSITFRSGGTSLSGQSSTRGILLDTRHHFSDIEVLDDGQRVRTQPGTTLRRVNGRLARFGRKLGPDPASEIAATIGGIIANNSSGMSCGVANNAYRTLESGRVVLPSGTMLDTADPEADEILRRREPRLYEGLLELRQRILGNEESRSLVQQLFAIKNTMGYSVNAFIDFERPIDILLRLMVGSEGTLGFLAEATWNTIPAHAHSATGLLVFANLDEAIVAVAPLQALGFDTVELLDATSLSVAQRLPDAPAELAALKIVAHAALLIEVAADSQQELLGLVDATSELLRALPTVAPATLKFDSAHRNALWRIRKGLYASVAGNRPTGTTALLEDIAVPLPQLAETCRELDALLREFSYSDSVIFGHAKDGNVHFMLTENLEQESGLGRYHAFTEQMVDLVLSHSGTLKAEHGTGRMMAPYLRRQYGDELYLVMQQIKLLFDPQGILNPGVLIHDDAQAHLNDFKSTHPVHEFVDRCVDCGYCEPICPSASLTLTPRQRIAVLREVAAATAAGKNELANTLVKEFDYAGVSTCAVDSLCATSCPLGIDTGELVRTVRARSAAAPAEKLWGVAARHWSTTTRIAATALNLSQHIPKLAGPATTVLRAALGSDNVPLWTPDLPGGGTPRQSVTAGSAAAVHFASCTNSMFESVSPGGSTRAFQLLAQRAGIELRTPDDMGSLCCGTPWKSKGLVDGYASTQQRATKALEHATMGWTLPIIVDAASCTEGLLALLRDVRSAGATPRVIDAVQFTHDELLPRLRVSRNIPSLTLHPTCSSTKLGIDAALHAMANAMAHEVHIPIDWGCCAFAGDRGMLHPELTAAATARESAEVKALGSTRHISCNRTCEIGMTRATGHPYQHILELLVECTE